MAEDFDAASWPQATKGSEDGIGMNNKKFSGAGASFIWSTNVVLDNEVLLRYEAKTVSVANHS